MANKKNRSKPNARLGSSTHSSQVWPDRIVNEVLSYLNSQIAFLDPGTETRTERDLESVDQEIAQRLNHLRDDGKNSLERLRNYSTKQIRAKLSRLYAQYKRTENDEDDLTVIYTQGFACLDWTGDSDRLEEMVRRSGEIKHNWTVDFLKSPRKTRSGSQASGSLQHPPRRDVRLSSNPSQPRKRVEKSREAGVRPRRQKHAIANAQHVMDTESLATEYVEHVVKIENVAQKPSILLTAGHDEMQRLCPLFRDSQEIPDSEPEAFGTPLRSFSPASRGDALWNRNVSESGSILELTEQSRNAEKQLQTVTSNAWLEIDFWKTAYSKAQKELSEWRNAKNILDAKVNALMSSSQSKFSIDDIVEHKAIIDRLLDERDSRDHFQYLKHKVDDGRDDNTVSKVAKLMQQIRSDLQAALGNVVFLSVAELQILPHDHLLSSLVEQAFGVKWNSAEALELLESWQERPWLRQFGLLALCGTAIACWVFQQTQADILFDRYQHAGTRSLTNRYRYAIELVGHSDPALARSIDLKVHKSLFEEDFFEHFQKAKGTDLARKLQLALAPLCKLDPSFGEQPDPESDVDGYAIEQLSHAFFKAIDVQCQLVLTGQRYECMWHEPGAHFDEASMVPYNGQKASPGDMSTIKLTLLPGIDQVTASRIGVDFGGFAERRHRDYEEAVCLVPAVILRESTNLD